MRPLRRVGSPRRGRGAGRAERFRFVALDVLDDFDNVSLAVVEPAQRGVSAPLVGLADAIVDLVETGETLKRNGLVELETLFPVSTRLIFNQAAFRLKSEGLRELEQLLEPSE